MLNTLDRWRRRARRWIPILSLALVLTACVGGADDLGGLTYDEQFAYAGDCSSCKGAKGGCANGGACPNGQWCDTGFCDCCCDNTKPTGGNATYRTYKYASCGSTCASLNDTACPNKSGGLCWVTKGAGCEDLTTTATETLGLSPSGEYRLCNCEVTCDASLPGDSTKDEGCGKPGNGKCPALVCAGSAKVKNCALAAQNCSKKTGGNQRLAPAAPATVPASQAAWDDVSALAFPTPTPTASPTPSPSASPTPWPTASPTVSPTASPTPWPTASPSPEVCTVCGPDEVCEPCTSPSPSPSPTAISAGWGG